MVRPDNNVFGVAGNANQLDALKNTRLDIHERAARTA